MGKRNYIKILLVCLPVNFFVGIGTMKAQAPIQKPERPTKETPTKQKPANTTKAETKLHVSGKINDYEYVDLGLSVKWATCNIGANKPEDFGNYFAWGETKPKPNYSTKRSLTKGKSMHDISGNENYDAARDNWGSTWRIPTRDELCELIENCTSKWTAINGVKGKLYVSKKKW